MIKSYSMIYLSKPSITESDKRAVLGVLSCGQLTSGPRVEEFERAFTRHAGTKYAVATSSGTTALHAALLSAGIKPEDNVLCPAFTFIATSNAILFCNARPVFCDCDPQTFNISPGGIEDKLKKGGNARALIVVHLYGLACDMARIRKISRKHNLVLIEDCAQAAGAKYRGKRVGGFGNIATFSFYATKNMTTGEGGMITTNDKYLAERCRSLINHGRSSRFTHDSLGYNYRMTDFQAALGASQLSRLDALNGKRIENAAYLTKNLKGIPWLETPKVAPGYKHVFHQYTVKIAGGRDRLMAHLNNYGVAAAPFYPIPLHKQGLYRKLGYSKIHLPVAEKLAKEVLCLPIHPLLKKTDLDKIIKAVKSYRCRHDT